MKIINIQKVETKPVYDITVNNAHHYILENSVITHNSGLEYSASEIGFLNKKKDTDEKSKDVTGVIITVTLKKSRISIENRKVETLLNYQTGLDRYYGLLDLADRFGIFRKIANKYELPDGKTVFGKAINKNPEKYFTPEILELIDAECQKHFLYGKAGVNEEDETVNDDD